MDNYSDGVEPMEMADAVPHLLGPGLGRLVWLLSPVVWSLWAISSVHETILNHLEHSVVKIVL